jgi:hypothetical protein
MGGILMTVQVLNAGAWKPATPKGVMVGGAWVAPKKMYVLAGGAWKLVWDEAAAAEPPYLYACDVVYKPGYVVDFTARIGAPTDPDEAFMFQCVQIPRNGYVSRTFSKTFTASGYSKLDCTLEDLSNVPGRDRRKIEFYIQPRP